MMRGTPHFPVSYQLAVHWSHSQKYRMIELHLILSWKSQMKVSNTGRRMAAQMHIIKPYCNIQTLVDTICFSNQK